MVNENVPKKSKRTILFNPWITPGIIVYVNKNTFTTSPFISEHLSQFLNSFMRLVILPQKLKVGKVSLIFKKGDVQLFDNYRGLVVHASWSRDHDQRLCARRFYA